MNKRAKDPKNNGIGYIFLDEIYHALGFDFAHDFCRLDRIIFTTKPEDIWHKFNGEI